MKNQLTKKNNKFFDKNYIGVFFSDKKDYINLLRKKTIELFNSEKCEVVFKSKNKIIKCIEGQHREFFIFEQLNGFINIYYQPMYDFMGKCDLKDYLNIKEKIQDVKIYNEFIISLNVKNVTQELTELEVFEKINKFVNKEKKINKEEKEKSIKKNELIEKLKKKGIYEKFSYKSLKITRDIELLKIFEKFLLEKEEFNFDEINENDNFFQNYTEFTAYYLYKLLKVII